MAGSGAVNRREMSRPGGFRDYWKGKGSQDTAFATCAKLKHIYESQ